ncbi:homoserine O-succinyltransferase [Eubacteriales bacterium OttesenSCG-928-M02]|nr:homoserine O-succinyltransferase [Eubacteriales bacterium OttesenSCG-928-M02]
MPVKIPNALPAAKTLADENIFVMTETRAAAQDIRPLRVAILNLMPTKEVTETQLLRLVGNTPLQVEVVFLNTASYTGTHTPPEHLSAFYRTFGEVQNQRFDGLIVTGAPVEHLDFTDVKYWEELQAIMRWANGHVYSTMYICWAAQAALYYNYGIPKYELEKKCFGIYPHVVLEPTSQLMRGFDDVFFAPHSRHTEIRREDIEKVPILRILAESPMAGVYALESSDKRQVFITGHSEYDTDTLYREYTRDKDKGMEIQLPYNYFPEDDDTKPPLSVWRGHANLLFSNWLNYYVYQETPFDLGLL